MRAIPRYPNSWHCPLARTYSAPSAWECVRLPRNEHRGMVFQLWTNYHCHACSTCVRVCAICPGNICKLRWVVSAATIVASDWRVVVNSNVPCGITHVSARVRAVSGWSESEAKSALAPVHPSRLQHRAPLLSRGSSLIRGLRIAAGCCHFRKTFRGLRVRCY